MGIGGIWHMAVQRSIDLDLQAFARIAANTLHVPFATIALKAAAHKALFVDHVWAVAHADIDVAALDNANAVAQNIPFFACVPIRTDAGETVGTLCCGSSDQRDLRDDEIDQLKDVAAQVAARMKVSEPGSAFAQV